MPIQINAIINRFVNDNHNPLYANNWMTSTPYGWPRPPQTPRLEAETVSEFNGYAIRLSEALEDNNNLGLTQVVDDILRWGGITNRTKLVKDLSKAIRDIKRDNIPDTEIDVILRKAKNQSSWRIASWSKILAAYKPGVFFIYDSRVAIALSHMSYVLRQPEQEWCFWQIPSPREEYGNPNNANERRKQEAFNNFKNIECGNNRKSSIPICYRQYLSLLNQWSNNNEIRRQFGNLDESIRNAYSTIHFSLQQAIMAHLEKMLFMQKEIILNPYLPD